MSELLCFAFVGQRPGTNIWKSIQKTCARYGYLLPQQLAAAAAAASGARCAGDTCAGEDVQRAVYGPGAEHQPEAAPPAPPPQASPELDDEYKEACLEALRAHVLSPGELAERGFPLAGRSPGHACYYVPPPPPRAVHYSGLRPDAAPFVPTLEPTPSTPAAEREEEVVRVCARCHRRYHMTRRSEYITTDACVYHPAGARGGGHACCGTVDGARGCTVATCHVSTGATAGFNGPVAGFARTSGSCGGAYALDVEMLFTATGLEAGSVALVSLDGRLAYYALVRPSLPVVDYNTRFSGLDAASMARAMKPLSEVQSELRRLVGADTLLVGHALENDLRALRLLHAAVVDTSALYPHARGGRRRRGLRELARAVLGREVQAARHDPLEDARAAMELALLAAGVARAPRAGAPGAADVTDSGVDGG